MARRLGFIGPAIVIVGALVAGVGVWYVVHARPRPGPVISTFPIDGTQSLVVRSEDGGERAFVELRAGDELKWQALVPHYAGTADRPALAWSQNAVSIRVEREGRAEVFAISMHDSAKLGGFRLAPEHEPIRTQPTGPITLTDHVRSYEIAGGQDWHQIVAIDLQRGKALWKVDLGKPAIE
ncbi:MAG: hypothetical protein JWO36_7448, partial [Myxococcales bacterium]|nr:hypothetical protein [Myxococcales bacterium]